MDNENTNPAEVSEEALDFAEEEAAFDAEFDDTPTDADDFDLTDGEEEAAGAEEEPAGEAEPEAEPEQNAGETPEETEEAQPEQQEEAENQRFVLRVNGQDSEVDREKVIELAQKGMDYDRIKAERDSFKAEAPTLQRYKDQEAFLKEMAENAKCSVEELMENTRIRVLMSKDKDLTEEAARQKVREDAAAKQAPAEKKEEEKAHEPSPEERRQAMFANFLQSYPDVKADSIPKEVWDDAGRTFDLTGAYQRYEIRQLREENKTLRQNKKNEERSTGSRKSVGNTTPKDPFDEAWDSL